MEYKSKKEVKADNKNKYPSTDDFWYDFIENDYIKPEQFLKDQIDIDKVNEAIKLIREFKNTINNKDLIIYH